MIQQINRLIILIVLCVILIYFLYIKSHESFAGNKEVPDECGTAGVRPSDASYKLIKKIFGIDLSTKRFYSQSECNKLDNGTYISGTCYQLKDDTIKNGNYDTSSTNIEINYTEQCGGLNKNTVVTPAPTECMIDGTFAGKPNIAFDITKTVGDKASIKVDDNAFRIYTKNECKLLDGTFTKISDYVKSFGGSDNEAAKAEHVNGSDMGMCISPELGFSMVCTINSGGTTSAQISDAAKGALKNWLTS